MAFDKALSNKKASDNSSNSNSSNNDHSSHPQFISLSSIPPAALRSSSRPQSPTILSTRQQFPISTSNSSSPDGGSRTPTKAKGPQKVRFPVDNNKETNSVYLPSEEDTNKTYANDVSTLAHYQKSSSNINSPSGGGGGYFNLSSASKFRSPLSTPPINIEFVGSDHTKSDIEYHENSNVRDYARGYNSYYDDRPPLSRNGSSQALLTTHNEREDYDDVIDFQTEEGELASRSMLEDAVGHQSEIASNIFQIGGITSGGLAPGAGLGDNDARLQTSSGASRRYVYDKDDPEANITLLNSQINSGLLISTKDGPYINGRLSESDIPMALLDRKLGEVATIQEENELRKREEDHVDEIAQGFAEHLVRSHSKFLSSRPPSPHKAGLTISSRAFFDHTPNLIDLEENQVHGHTVNEFKSTRSNSNESANNQERNSNHSITSSKGSGNSNSYHQDNEPLLIENSVIDDNKNSADIEDEYVPPPSHVRKGILGSLFMLYGTSHKHGSNNDDSYSNPPSGASTPRKSFTGDHHLSKSMTDLTNIKAKSLFKLHKSRSTNTSTTSLNEIVTSSAHSMSSMLKVPIEGPKKPSRPKPYRMSSGLDVRKTKKDRERKKREERQRMDITLHIAEVLQRQRFILRLCRALMMFGAPTHRLEEYMMMTSRALEIDGQFLYIPGCMIVSFDDSSTHTSEMQLVRCIQGVNLYKLNETYTIYKDVIHGNLRIDQALEQLEEQFSSKNLYPPWLCVLFFGFSSVAVGPFAFGGRWHDMPIAFFLGGSVGILQIVVAPRSTLYNNVFEVTASIVVSFLSRAFGSIGKNQDIFCFAAIAQSALALILPGYIILCGSLELQSRNIVAGSVRMFYAIIYSLFLGFGITLGAVIYGWIDSGATSQTTCPYPMNPWWRALFVPLFTLGLALVNQAHWRQIPVMLVISGAGYAATYFSGLRLVNASELTSALAALVIGVLGNVYSRVGHGLAFVAMLPAIFVQVPSGVASQGSLVAGIDNANHIVGNKTTDAQIKAAGLTENTVMNLGITMVQISIGITVGLFVATLVIYPFGKKRSGLFTF